MTWFGEWKEKILVEGLMPERSLLRLRRAGIPVYEVKKIEKNRIVFLIKKKDSEKVFAIYPNLCYNESVSGAYKVKRIGSVGIGKYVEKFKNRVGLALGGLLCLAIVVWMQPFIFSVEFSGTAVYARETQQALNEAGFGVFKPYQTGKEDWICSRILALDGVEFCSIKKVGHRLIVDVRTSPFPTQHTEKGVMRAKHSGKIVKMTVLRGTALKQIGENVQAGEVLVDNVFESGEGEHVRVEIIARVRIACVWEGEIQTESAEQAFAQAYLDLGLSDMQTITSTQVLETENGYTVKIEYESVETWNF